MIAAVMATRFDPPERKRLLETLIADNVFDVVMVDAGPHPEDWTIYRLWNNGVKWAIKKGAEFICVMNDDITILPGTLKEMAAHLVSSPDVGVVYPDARRRTKDGIGDTTTHTTTTGTWGSGGMTGFCFMFRADLNIPFDETLEWWYGDDQFEQDVRNKGLSVARIDELPIDHKPDGSASKIWDEMSARIAHDRTIWDAREAQRVATMGGPR